MSNCKDSVCHVQETPSFLIRSLCHKPCTLAGHGELLQHALTKANPSFRNGIPTFLSYWYPNMVFQGHCQSVGEWDPRGCSSPSVGEGRLRPWFFLVVVVSTTCCAIQPLCMMVLQATTQRVHTKHHCALIVNRTRKGSNALHLTAGHVFCDETAHPL